MKFTRICLTNFVPYEGEVSIPLEPKEGKNLYVFVGINGSGKTSLLRALRWVFDSHASRKDDLLLWNSKVKKREIGDMSVEVCLIDDSGEDWIIKKSSTRIVPGPVSVVNNIMQAQYSVRWKGKAVSEDVATEYVEKYLIPANLTKFFFFGGEEITRYSGRGAETEVRTAVETSLGLDMVRNAIEDLESVRGELSEEYDDQAAKQKVLAPKIGDLKLKERKRDDAKRQLDEIDHRLEEVRGVLTQREEELGTHPDYAQLLAQRADASQKVSQAETALSNTRGRLENQVRQLYKRILLKTAEGLESKSRSHMAETRAKAVDGSDAASRLHLITSSVSNRRCELCGLDLNEPVVRRLDSAAKSLTGQVQPKGWEAANAAEEEWRSMNAVLTSAKTAANALADAHRAHLEAERRLSEAQTALRSVEGRLKGFSVGEYESLQKLVREATAKRDALLEHRGATETERKAVDLEIDRMRDEITKLSPLEGRILVLKQQIDICRAMESAFEEALTRYVKKKKDEIEKKTTEVFRQLTNKPREYSGIRIGDGFQFQVVTASGEVPDMELEQSGGERTVASLAFIIGLANYTNLKIPVVMDAPLSVLDNIHTPNTLRLIAELAKNHQVLAMFKTGDLDRREHLFEDEVAEEFVIFRDEQERRSYIEEGPL